MREVWYWQDGRLSFHALRGDRHETVDRSELLPALDSDQIAPDERHNPSGEAVQELRAVLRNSRT